MKQKFKFNPDLEVTVPKFLCGNGKLFLTHKDRERAWKEMMEEDS